MEHVEKLILKVIRHTAVDASVDQMAKIYMEDTLPPVLTEGRTQILYPDIFFLNSSSLNFQSEIMTFLHLVDGITDLLSTHLLITTVFMFTHYIKYICIVCK